MSTGTQDALAALPPWDAAAYFQTPVETLIQLVGNTNTKVISADPNRIALFFASSNIGNLVVSTKATQSGNTGFAVSSSTGPIKLLFTEVGPLCQLDWYGWASGASNLTVITVSLYRWPAVQAPGGRRRRANA